MIKFGNTYIKYNDDFITDYRARYGWSDWRQAASKIGNFSMRATNKNLITLKEFNEL